MQKKKYGWLIRVASCLGLTLMAMTACTQDAYNKGDSEISNLRADFVEAIVGQSGKIEAVITDDDERLELTSPFSVKWAQQRDTTYRAVLYYNKVEGKAEPYGCNFITTFSILHSPQLAGKFKRDPLTLESIWLSGHKRYLNLRLALKSGAVAENAHAQTLSVWGDSLVTDARGRHVYMIHLAHNQGDEPEYYTRRVYISIPLQGLDTDSLRITVNTYDGEITKGFRL